jgi:hypothetical protein
MVSENLEINPLPQVTTEIGQLKECNLNLRKAYPPVIGSPISIKRPRGAINNPKSTVQ